MSFVDVVFNIQGDRIPADHGYYLFSAVSEIVSDVHGDGEVGIHAISGILQRDRTLAVSPRSSLRVRLADNRVKDVMTLAGKTLEIGGHRLAVGIPNTKALVPAARLYSRLVVIKGFMEPEPFLDAAKRQLVELGIKGEASLISTAKHAEANKDRRGGTRSPWLRRTVKIRDKNIVGFALSVEELTAEESILLQEKGIGGRRRFGCGIFIPARE